MTDDKKEVALCGLGKSTIQEIEDITANFQISLTSSKTKFERDLLVANGIAQLEEVITEEVMKPILYLKNNKLGFLTDEESRGKAYTFNQVKRCWIEATLRGLSSTGNQWNIIAGNVYVTKEGFTGLLQDLPGFTDFTFNPGVPKWDNDVKQHVMDFSAKWKMKGIEQTLEGKIPIICNQKSKIDALMGKGERKIKYRVHTIATGSQTSDVDELDQSELKQTAKKTITADNMGEK